jgi:hypothetical protein
MIDYHLQVEEREKRYHYDHHQQNENNTSLLAGMDHMGLTAETRWGMTAATYGSSLRSHSAISPQASLNFSIPDEDVKTLSSRKISVTRWTTKQSDGTPSYERKSILKERMKHEPFEEASNYNTPYYKKAFMKYGVTPGSLFSEDTLTNLSTMVLSEESTYTDATFMETMDRIQNEVEVIEKMIMKQRQRQELLRERTRLRQQRKEQAYRESYETKEAFHHSSGNTLSTSMDLLHKKGAEYHRQEIEPMSSNNEKELLPPTMDRKDWKGLLNLSHSSLKMIQSSHYGDHGLFDTSIEDIQKTGTSLISMAAEDLSETHHMNSVHELDPISMAETGLHPKHSRPNRVGK